MAGNANVYGAIADYLETIHTSFIWPALFSKDGKKPGPRPDSLVTFCDLMMRTHARATLLLDPGRPVGRCDTDNDCEQDHECVGGMCVPVSPPKSFLDELPKPCRIDNDCEQDEECIEGVCTPSVGSGMDPRMVTDVMLDANGIREALEIYYGRIYGVVIKVMAGDPRHVSRVRELLMQLYAGAARASGRKLPDCNGPGDCPDGSACVQGHCVPIPFRLALRTAPFRAPWK